MLDQDDESLESIEYEVNPKEEVDEGYDIDSSLKKVENVGLLQNSSFPRYKDMLLQLDDYPCRRRSVNLAMLDGIMGLSSKCLSGDVEKEDPVKKPLNEEILHDSLGTYITENVFEEDISIRSIPSSQAESFANDDSSGTNNDYSLNAEKEDNLDEYDFSGDESVIFVNCRQSNVEQLDSSLHYEVEGSSAFTKQPTLNQEDEPSPSLLKGNIPTSSNVSRDNDRARISISWRERINRLLVSNTAIARVGLENKIGKPASELSEDNPLRIIAMSVQRSLRCYEAVRASQKHKMECLNVYSKNKGLLKFPATKKYALIGKAYGIPQPSFQCEQMCAEEFKKIRKALGISDRQYHAVLNLEERRMETSFNVIEAKEASGKSGSFFFLSPDQRYILKSCPKSDVKTLCKILPGYRDYVEKAALSKEGSAYGTLLPRYLGLYSLKFDRNEIPDTTIVVMTNFFAGSHKIHYKFDLKGSTYKRAASEKERQKKSPVYKDNDWIDMEKKLTFPEERITNSIQRQLELDTTFLSEFHLIDYSMLVGIHDDEVKNCKSFTHDCLDKNRDESMGVIFSSSKRTKEIRYFGIVDILTPYRAKKRAETLFTGDLIGRHDISCQPPGKYARRFCKFMTSHVLETETDEEDDDDDVDEKTN